MKSSDPKPQGRHYVYTLAYPSGYIKDGVDLSGRVFYVGKGVGKRMYVHEWNIRWGKKDDNPYKTRIIKNIWASGKEIMKTKLAHFATHEEALEYERALIFFMDGLTNLSPGGDGYCGPRSPEHNANISKALKGKKRRPLSAELRQKLSAIRKGGKRSAETRRRMSEAQKGKKLSEEAVAKMRQRSASEETRAKLRQRSASEETKEKLRQASLGKKHSLEARQKISAAHKGRIVSEAERKMISERFRGRKMSEEHKERLRAISKQRKLTQEQIDKLVACNVKTYPGFISPDGTVYRNVTNLRQFCLKHGLNDTRMAKVSRGEYKQSQGWRAIPQEEAQ